MKLTLERLGNLLLRVTYKNWVLRARAEGRGFLLYATFRAEDGKQWRSRKWYVSTHASTSEVLQTALKCVLTAEEHETREAFLVDGRPVFGPHYDVGQLVELCDAEAFDLREERAPS